MFFKGASTTLGDAIFGLTTTLPSAGPPTTG